MGGTSPPPFKGNIFGKKGVMDLGGTPLPPFTDKIRKVVFDPFPKVAKNYDENDSNKDNRVKGVRIFPASSAKF